MLRGEKKKGFLAVVDTGVLAEYINESSINHEKVKVLLEGDNTLYITPITLSEVVYVSYRIYKASGLDNANLYAIDFVNWLLSEFEVIEINREIIIKAGEIKKRYGIALSDCYVVASADYLKVKALFKKEKEILQAMDKLRNEFNDLIIFIDEV